MGSKRLDFIDWVTVHNMKLNKEHLTNNGALIIKGLKDNMNNKRTYFDWDHLDYFYS